MGVTVGNYMESQCFMEETIFKTLIFMTRTSIPHYLARFRKAPILINNPTFIIDIENVEVTLT